MFPASILCYSTTLSLLAFRPCDFVVILQNPCRLPFLSFSNGGSRLGENRLSSHGLLLLVRYGPLPFLVFGLRSSFCLPAFIISFANLLLLSVTFLVLCWRWRYLPLRPFSSFCRISYLFAAPLLRSICVFFAFACMFSLTLVRVILSVLL